MFRKTPAHQSGLFTKISTHLSARRRAGLQDASAWHNVFARQVVARIDEAPYGVLYATGQGRPNGSVQRLVPMMILKEGNGWTDQQLFDECDYNLQVMRALGFNDLDQQVPCPSTFYSFRAALAAHQG